MGLVPRSCKCRRPILLGLVLVSSVACSGEPPCDGSDCSVETPTPSPDSTTRDLTDGWDAPPGTGTIFVIDSLAIAEYSRGFDIDGICTGEHDCVDNVMWQLGQLGNDQIRQGLLGGESLLLMELAGLDLPFDGNDERVTIKLYPAADVDDDGANNFQIPAGQTSCCEFRIHPRGLSSEWQARSRIRARIEKGVLTTVEPGAFTMSLTIGTAPHGEMRLRRAQFEARVSVNLQSLSDGLIGGAIPAVDLARIDNPYCKTLNQLCPRQLPESTLIDLIAGIQAPDIDLDQDGFEVLDIGGNGRVIRCLDGDGELIPALSEDAPWTCVSQPGVADAYSVGMSFHAVRATVLGVGL